jgi:hypothetical protein
LFNLEESESVGIECETLSLIEICNVHFSAPCGQDSITEVFADVAEKAKAVIINKNNDTLRLCIFGY